MLKTNKITTITLLIFVILAYSIMPIVSRLFSAYLTTYAYLAVVLVTVLAVLLIGKQDFLINLFPIIIPLIILNVLIYFSTNPSIIMWVYSLLLNILAIVIGIYVIQSYDTKLLKILTYFILVIHGITALTTIIGLNNNPDAARYLATVADSNEADAVKYGFMNIGGFEFVYSVALIYPAIIYGFKRKKIHVSIVIIYAVIDFILVINTGYTIALLLFIASTVFVFFRNNLTVKNVVIIFVITLLVSLLVFPLFSYLLDALADVIGNETIAERLRDLAGGREGLEASEDNRLALYMTSLTSFITHPLFGGMFNSVSIGGHSEILDKIAQYGIFGLIAIVLIYSAIYKKFFKVYKNESGYGYVFWIFMQAVILSVLNPGMWIYQLALMIPVILAYINQKENKNEGSLDSKLFNE
ncbi:MAG: hypothetical protein IJQ07_00090 [Clostridia bacterium]|nr:hypothetical protein [Clostridia bacterium]